ncbi:hypothetical protein HU200_032486 [Digitaria exilis]|uniref:Uncharacterized protein n=1 Tax=Digitaria exilis TaxID=1010633 RepID=A0A835BN35_9POAL|nr:hypothetical protein HU200_032486 [Digitaria exilis]
MGAWSCCLAVAVTVGLIALVVFTAISKRPTYSVAITGVAGLDPAADLLSASRPTLSPVFNLTVRIDNAHWWLSAACVDGSLATAAVTYRDAFLGNGSVPEFCTGKGKARERGARAWGHGVDLPRLLRDQLAGELAAGEAAVDVEVMAPDQECNDYHCVDMVLTCSQAKIGGGPSPCKMMHENVHHPHQEGSAD